MLRHRSLSVWLSRRLFTFKFSAFYSHYPTFHIKDLTVCLENCVISQMTFKGSTRRLWFHTDDINGTYNAA